MEQRSVNLDDLTAQQRINIYKASAALLQGKQFDDIDTEHFEKLNEKQQISYLELQVNHLDTRRDMYTAVKGEEDLPDKPSPRDYLAARLKNPVADDSIIAYYALLNGYEEPTNDDYAALAEFYAGDGSTLNNRVKIVTDFNNNAEKQEAEQLALTERQAALETKFEFLGYDPKDTTITTPHQKELEQTLGMNIKQIDDALRDGNVDVAEAVANKLLKGQYTVETALTKIHSDDPEIIKQGQHLLGVPATGERDIATNQAALDQLKNPNVLGEDYYFTSNDNFKTNVAISNIEKGIIPVLEEALPENVTMLIGTGMENQAIAMYLADRQNFDAYNQALIEHTKTLETQYGANLQREIDVLNPAILQPGADTELAAQDQNIEVSEDGILTADQGLQVLTDKVLAYVEKLPEMNIGEGIDYNNISFSQMIHHDYMATTWYDQIYGSEFTVGDRSVVDTVLENGLSMEDAAKITGLDINESLDLENPENLALFTETVFLMTHGKNLPEGVTYNKEQFLVASYNVLGEEIPKEKTPEQVENEMLHAKIDNISSNLYNDLYNFVELDSDLPNAPQGLRDLKQLKIDMDTSDTNLLNTRKSFLADNPDIDIVDYEHPADLKRDMYIAENEFIKSFLDMPETEQQAILKYITDRTHEIETELKQGNTPDATKHASLNVSTPFTGAASPIPFEGDAQQYAAKLKEMGNPDVGANTPSNLPKPEAFA